MTDKLIPLRIAGVGYSLPETVITNDDLTKLYETSDEWIYTRTGIKERRVVSGEQNAIDLGLEAAQNALAKAKMKPEEIDLILAASSAPPDLYPAIACHIQSRLGITKPIPAFDITAACSGLIYGLSIAKAVPSSKVYCIEKSKDAFEYLKKNSDGVNNAILINDDIFNDIDIEQADLIISNPPYIKTDVIQTLQDEVKKEPMMALDGGTDGLNFYRVINDKWSKKLKPNGVLMLEIGEDQGKTIIDVLSDFNSVEVLKDMYGNDRMVVAKR